MTGLNGGIFFLRVNATLLTWTVLPRSPLPQCNLKQSQAYVPQFQTGTCAPLLRVCILQSPRGVWMKQSLLKLVWLWFTPKRSAVLCPLTSEHLSLLEFCSQGVSKQEMSRRGCAVPTKSSPGEHNRLVNSEYGYLYIFSYHRGKPKPNYLIARTLKVPEIYSISIHVISSKICNIKFLMRLSNMWHRASENLLLRRFDKVSTQQRSWNWLLCSPLPPIQKDFIIR